MPAELAVAALRRRRVNLLVWAAIEAALVLLIVAFYPSIKGDTSLEKTFADFPEVGRGKKPAEEDRPTDPTLGATT